MKRREFILGGTAATWPVVARAQQAKMPVVGFLGSASLEKWGGGVLIAFKRGLADTGYEEGRTVAIEYRWAEEQYDRLPNLALELARQRVAVIAAPASVASASAARAATKTIPIVFMIGSDPIELGLVESLNRPGGNLTGVAYLNVEVAPKRLELLHELVPSAKTIALLVNPANPIEAETQTKELQAAGRSLGLHVPILLKGAKPSELPVQRPTNLAFIFNLKTARALGLIVPATLLARADEVIE